MRRGAPHPKQFTPIGIGLLLMFAFAEWKNPEQMPDHLFILPIVMIVIGKIYMHRFNRRGD